MERLTSWLGEGTVEFLRQLITNAAVAGASAPLDAASNGDASPEAIWQAWATKLAETQGDNLGDVRAHGDSWHDHDPPARAGAAAE